MSVGLRRRDIVILVSFPHSKLYLGISQDASNGQEDEDRNPKGDIKNAELASGDRSLGQDGRLVPAHIAARQGSYEQKTAQDGGQE